MNDLINFLRGAIEQVRMFERNPSNTKALQRVSDVLNEALNSQLKAQKTAKKNLPQNINDDDKIARTIWSK